MFLTIRVIYLKAFDNLLQIIVFYLLIDII
jgi:hypothetical protein